MKAGISQSNILTCVLAGGQSRRMGGGDKTLLPLGAKSMLDLILERLKPQARHIVLNANGDSSRFAAYGLTVLPDPVGEFAGPLAGIFAGLSHAKTLGSQFSHVVSVAGDTPFFPKDLVGRLSASVPLDKPVIALASSHDKLHPVFGLWPVALADDLHTWLSTGQSGKVLAFVDRHDSVEVAFDEPTETGLDPFFNANRPDDLEKARAAMEALSS
ncbi:molybdenum cofactor guanylyltransferase [Roseibium hamelinense]|uniref:Molybdenum cofactor guanylyltransferase n=1 Tax=Roseibium hamelinense TaxID=150831 RepID=A0A562T963_9HYPH|nr:molybdenum cofactor guanylyltransferase MobA [Roseibium hamelinense]MTI42101.1 molybdenum cofactor guanylyltransferase MobA [Roseibium hamelinense]TWI89536.1 molybdenum cofactor guanylyltransferase [Roseibium hamelinense]